MLKRLKEIILFEVKFPLNIRGVSYIILLHCFFSTFWQMDTIVQFFHFVAEEKNRRQKNKGVLWLGYHRYPSKKGKAFYVVQSQSEVMQIL